MFVAAAVLLRRRPPAHLSVAIPAFFNQNTTCVSPSVTVKMIVPTVACAGSTWVEATWT